MKIVSIVGARPNFMKIAPFIKAIEAHNAEHATQVQHLLVHTGQHYDDRMSQSFFDALNIPQADINLGVGSGTHAYQVGHTMIEFEKVMQEHAPDWVVVVGDVNATMACSITAKKQHKKVCHIEAGLRSGDMTMPEEINRLVTDRLSDLLLTPDQISSSNLRSEGIPESKIKFVGNIMIDTLLANQDAAQSLHVRQIAQKNQFEGSPEMVLEDDLAFAVVTLHRPSNVDHEENLGALIDFLINDVVVDMHILWPVHPRTKKQLMNFGLWEQISNNNRIVLLQPLGYHEMLKLNMDCKIMLTDSGGIQEECTVLGTPCLTLRQNTERPITLKKNGGVGVLVGNDLELLKNEYQEMLHAKHQASTPDLWDGLTAQRCLQAILEHKQEEIIELND